MWSIDGLRRVAGRVCTAAAMERRIEPTLADVRNEYLDAVQRRQYARCRWLQAVGVMTVLKVVALVMLEAAAHDLAHPDAATRAVLRKASAIFGAVVTVTTMVLAWVPFNTMPVANPIDARELLYLIPQALPIAIPIGLSTAIVLGFAGRLSPRITAAGLAWAVICSVLSFVTLAWWAPTSNQAYRTKIVGFEIAKGDNELTLGELATRIDQIRAFDPAAPARRLSVLYHTRWALSAAPLVLAVFALAMIRRLERGGLVLTSIAVITSGGFALLVIGTSYLAFRGMVSPPVAAWLPNLTFVVLAATAMLWSISRTSNKVC